MAKARYLSLQAVHSVAASREAPSVCRRIWWLIKEKFVEDVAQDNLALTNVVFRRKLLAMIAKS